MTTGNGADIPARPPAIQRFSAWSRKYLPALLSALACIALFAWTLWQRWSFLDSSPYPFGVDGYYYPIQLRSLMERGELYYPSAPLALWLMAPLTWFADPIPAAKLGAALGTSLIIWPAHVLGRRIDGTRATGVLAAALVATSPSSFYFTAEFVKNGLGLTMALVFLCVLARALDAGHEDRTTSQRTTTRLWLAAAAASLLAVILTHKLATVFAVSAALPPVMAQVLRHHRGDDGHGTRSRAGVKRVIARFVLAPVAVLLVLGILAPERFPSHADLALLGELFTREPVWSLPVLAPPGSPPLTMQSEVALAALFSLIACAMWLTGWPAPSPDPILNQSPNPDSIPNQSPDPDPIQSLDPIPAPNPAPIPDPTGRRGPGSGRLWVLGPALVALLLGLPWLAVDAPQGPGFRLRLLAFIPLALSAAAVAGPVLRRLSPLHRSVAIAAFATALLFTRPVQPDRGIARAHPAMVAATQAVSPLVPRDHAIVTAERHILFMVAWYGDREVVLRPETIAENRRWRLLPMALMSPALRATIDLARRDTPTGIPPPRGVHPAHRNGLVVMPEITWQWILSRLPSHDRAFYRRWKTI